MQIQAGDLFKNIHSQLLPKDLKGTFFYYRCKSDQLKHNWTWRSIAGGITTLAVQSIPKKISEGVEWNLIS